MASTSWYQGGQPPFQQNTGYYQPPVQQNPQVPFQPPVQQVPQPVQRKKTNPPPVCFNCGVEGHFLVACPEATRNTPGGFTPAPAPRPYQQAPGPNQHNQQYAPQAGPVQQAPYQTAPHQPGPPQYGNVGQQHSYNTPQPPQPHHPQPSQQPYSQPPQYGQAQYGQPPQYGQPGYQPGVQQAPYNQNFPNGPPQFSTSAYQGPPQPFPPSAPVPYQQPPNPYPQANGSYGGAYQASPVQYQPPQQPQDQWNNAPRVTQPPYQHQQHHGPGQQGYSGPPNPQMQRARSQSQQPGHNFKSPYPGPPHTPMSNPASRHQASRRGSMITPDTKPGDVSKVSSRASTPYGRYGSGDNMLQGGSIAMPTPSASQNHDLENHASKETEEADEEELFNWDFKHIFTEPAIFETVALAQPLSANFKSTPVPLVQAWSLDVPSVSRYARKENLKEFVRPIRDLPQWSYSQEDPAFSDIQRGGPSIPLIQLPYWITMHHEGIDRQPDEELLDESLEAADEPTGVSRKRGRSEEAEESTLDDIYKEDGDLNAEYSGDEKDGTPRVKRSKKFAQKDADDMMTIPTARTPVIGYRSGTPCFETEGDAWAPEPGETASTPQDPTEALLASLGVTGSPKPIKRDPIPAYMHNLEEQPRPSRSSQPPVDREETPKPPPSSQPIPEPSTTHQPLHNAQHGKPINTATGPLVNTQNAPTMQSHNGSQMNMNAPQNQTMNAHSAPQNLHGQQGAPVTHQYGGNTSQYGPPANGPYVNGQAATPPYGAPAGNYPQGHQQYGGTANGPYQNGPPQSYGNHQYGQAPNGSYANGPPPPNNYGPPQQGQPQWAPPTQQSYNHGQPAQAPQGHAPYPQQNAPYGNQPHGPVNASYQNQPGPYYPPGPPQYGQQPGSSFGNRPPVPGAYGTQTQESPAHYPPQNGQYGPNTGHPQPQYNQSQPAPSFNGNGPPDKSVFPGGPPQQQLRGPHGHGPPRQDSGYMSARGSYSNETSPQEYNSNHGHPVPPVQSTLDGPSSPKPEAPSKDPEKNSSAEMTRKDSDTGSRGTDSTGTPLSPNSKEILGLLEDDGTAEDRRKAKIAARKLRRPQPVVAEAYGRRW